MVTIALLFLTIAVSLYDLRSGRVPNWVTLPLLAAGLLAHFPGSGALWSCSLILFLAWNAGWMAAGDAKLWMALLWALPPGIPDPPLRVFATFIATGLLQLGLRKFRRQPLTGMRSPGAWRTIPFLFWSFHVH